MLDDNGPSEMHSLKYANELPKDYGISKMQYTFDFINLVLNHGASIEDALKGVANEYGLSENVLMDYLVENKYLLNKANMNDISGQLKSYNTKSLKKILKKHGLKTSGKREKIEKRIIDNHLLGNDYHLSSKSKVFYTNKKRRIRIFDKYLTDYYYFDEFNEFYMDNYRKKESKIPVEFIKLHIAKATEDENHDDYLLSNRIMAEHYLKKENYRKMLEYTLRNYCMNMNPIWKIGNLESHFGLAIDTYEYLMFLNDELSRNIIINTYYLVWDSFNFERIIVSKYDGYRYLKDLLNRKDFARINQDLDKKFYANEDLKIKTITQKTLFDF